MGGLSAYRAFDGGVRRTGCLCPVTAKYEVVGRSLHHHSYILSCPHETRSHEDIPLSMRCRLSLTDLCPVTAKYEVVSSSLHHHSHIVSCPHEAQLINPSEQTPRTEASSKKNSQCFHSIVRFHVLIHSFNQCRVHAVRVPGSSKPDASGRLHVGLCSHY